MVVGFLLYWAFFPRAASFPVQKKTEKKKKQKISLVFVARSIYNSKVERPLNMMGTKESHVK